MADRSPTAEVKPGIDRHYKNKEYRVIGCAKHTETEEEFVVYEALYGERRLWIRPKAMFLVTVGVEGERVLRIQFISQV